MAIKTSTQSPIIAERRNFEKKLDLISDINPTERTNITGMDNFGRKKKDSV